MARQTKPLTNTETTQAKPKTKEYTLTDGQGLMLRIRPNGSKSRIFNYYRPFTKKRANIASFPAVFIGQSNQLTNQKNMLNLV